MFILSCIPPSLCREPTLPSHNQLIRQRFQPSPPFHGSAALIPTLPVITVGFILTTLAQGSLTLRAAGSLAPTDWILTGADAQATGDALVGVASAFGLLRIRTP
jgi:hypothetical protein